MMSATSATTVAAVTLDPSICPICRENPHKYKCPKCNVRSCSLVCSKKHKEENNCDGVRLPFAPVAKLSQYDATKSVEDQRWMHSVPEKVYSEGPTTINHNIEAGSAPTSGVSVIENGHEENREEGSIQQQEQGVNEDGTRNSARSAQERFLLPNAARRRIWLSFSDEKDMDDCSRHEQFSDSIFWCIDFIFTKKMEDGSASEYKYRVQNIPETIRLATILKQFLRPRKYGCIVSESDLDMEKMAAFIEAGSEKINLLMRVPRLESERFYIVNPDRCMLDNVRNRVIVDHPKIIVALNNEFNFELLSEVEAEQIRERMQKERTAQNHQGGFRGRGGMNRGCRGGGRGFRGVGAPHFDGGSRGNWQPRGRGFGRGGGGPGGKRPWSGPDGGDSGFKRGRGRGNGRGNFRRRDLDEFDPFEPFEGKVSLPLNYGAETRATESWGNAVSGQKAATVKIEVKTESSAASSFQSAS